MQRLKWAVRGGTGLSIKTEKRFKGGGGLALPGFGKEGDSQERTSKRERRPRRKEETGDIKRGSGVVQRRLRAGKRG